MNWVLFVVLLFVVLLTVAIVVISLVFRDKGQKEVKQEAKSKAKRENAESRNAVPAVAEEPEKTEAPVYEESAPEEQAEEAYTPEEPEPPVAAPVVVAHKTAPVVKRTAFSLVAEGEAPIAAYAATLSKSAVAGGTANTVVLLLVPEAQEGEEVDPIVLLVQNGQPVSMCLWSHLTEEEAPVLQAVDAEQADRLLSDTDALAGVVVEEGATDGPRFFVNIGDIDKNFNAGDVVTLSALKAKKMVNKKAGRVKILSDGQLTKPLTVKANAFSIQAVKMIQLVGGTAVQLK